MNDLDVIDSKPLAAVGTPPPASIDIGAVIQSALASGRSMEELKAAFDLFERMEARRAEQEFNAAFAKFKAECPPIRKRTDNSQFAVTRNGVKRPARYAALEDIDADTKKALTANGLACSWGDAVVTGDSITLDCWVAHVGGHKRKATCTMPHESRAGASPQQKYASTITYLQRYSMIAALGLTTCDEDDDGTGGPAACIDEAQASTLNDLIISVGDSRGKPIDRAAFLTIFKAESLSDIPAARFDEACEKLERQRKAVAK